MSKAYRPATLGSVQFDAIIERSRQYEADVPTYPTEDGYVVSDAVLKKPLVLNVTAFVSNTPVTWSKQLGSSQSRVANVIRNLENMYFSGQLYNFSTPDRIYTRMAIKSLTIPEKSELRNAVEISITLQNVPVAKSSTVTIPASYGMSGDTNANGGTASTTDDGSEESTNKASSILFGLINGIKSLFTK